MYGVDLYRRIRLVCHHDGLSQREAAPVTYAYHDVVVRGFVDEVVNLQRP